ncbi:ATP-dependent DNA helicase [Thermodesulfobacteriota bacterium]
MVIRNIDLEYLSYYIQTMEKKLKTIEKILGEDGLLASSLDDFEYRPAQVQMAALIMDAIERNKQAIIEAGTGVGKTMGYLVPIMLSHKKSVISTGTKNLQEQIFFKDIPILSEILGFKINALLMKGRKNYICLNRYEQHFRATTFLNSEEEDQRSLIDDWLLKTNTGDRSELAWLGDDDIMWDSISSNSDQCKGSECLHRDGCYILNLRRLAAKADIIIVNHHLFFADLMIKTDGFGEVIPRFEAAVFDEAHRVEEIATNYFGTSISSRQLIDLVKDIQKETDGNRGEDSRKTALNLAHIRAGVEELNAGFSGLNDRGRLKSADNETFSRAIDKIKKGLGYIQDKMEQVFCNRAIELEHSIDMVFNLENSGWLNWYEKHKKGIAFHSSPLNVSENMREQLYSRVNSIIFTSATLSTNGNFDYMKARLGIEDDALNSICPSHYNFKEQVVLYIPEDLPLPGADDFTIRIKDRIIEMLKITSGRALVLFTSYYNLNTVYNQLRGELAYRVFRQGEAPRSVLLEKFRKNINSVLLATGSFWQGVDVPGEALSCLIIDKLPFDSPGDPLVAARMEVIREREGNPFWEYQVPSAVISLKQGLGRLIRKISDRGVMAVLDKRIIRSSYGSFFIKSLPEMTISNRLEDIRRYID